MHAAAVAEPRRHGLHRGGGHGKARGKSKPGDASAVQPHAGRMSHERPNATFERETKGQRTGKGPRHDDIEGRDARIAVSEGVEDDHASFARLVHHDHPPTSVPVAQACAVSATWRAMLVSTRSS